jgi:copper chaperone CopZ
MARLEKKYRGRVNFALLYTRESNPGAGRFRDVREPVTLAERMVLVQRLRADFDAVGRDPVWVVDDMANAIHDAYGSPKGASIVVARGGRTEFKRAWASADAVEEALEDALARGEAIPGSAALAGVLASPTPEPSSGGPGETTRELAAGHWVSWPTTGPAGHVAGRSAVRQAGLWVDVGSAAGAGPAGASGAVGVARPAPRAPAGPGEAAIVAAGGAAAANLRETAGTGRDPARTRAGDAEVPPAPLQVRVAGMICQGCAITVKEAVRRIPSVTHVSLDHDPRRSGLLSVQAGPEVTEREIRDAVNRTGFKALGPGDQEGEPNR